jgi:glyoxylase-like metal-dependent hydrolase (beta-lactamase superfamily II)
VGIHRLDLGYADIPAGVLGGPRVASLLAYLVRQDGAVILFDTGMGANDEIEAVYRIRRRELPGALASAGASLDEVDLVVNCHLHVDHCGGNPLLPGRPIIVQRTELALAGTADYTLPELVDFAGARYEQLDGEAEIRPGVWIIPTPGHTAGHQCLVVREPDGSVVLAGQTHDTAADFTAVLTGDPSDRPVWMDRLLAFDPRQVVFAHDGAVWTPDSLSDAV